MATRICVPVQSGSSLTTNLGIRRQGPSCRAAVLVNHGKTGVAFLGLGAREMYAGERISVSNRIAANAAHQTMSGSRSFARGVKCMSSEGQLKVAITGKLLAYTGPMSRSNNATNEMHLHEFS